MAGATGINRDLSARFAGAIQPKSRAHGATPLHAQRRLSCSSSMTITPRLQAWRSNAQRKRVPRLSPLAFSALSCRKTLAVVGGIRFTGALKRSRKRACLRRQAIPAPSPAYLLPLGGHVFSTLRYTSCRNRRICMPATGQPPDARSRRDCCRLLFGIQPRRSATA